MDHFPTSFFISHHTCTDILLIHTEFDSHRQQVFVFLPLSVFYIISRGVCKGVLSRGDGAHSRKYDRSGVNART